jgi:hypothetical protein
MFDQRSNAPPIKASAMQLWILIVVGSFSLDPPQLARQELPGIRLAKPIGRVDKRRQQVFLAVRIAQPRITADACQTPIGEQESANDLP